MSSKEQDQEDMFDSKEGESKDSHHSRNESKNNNDDKSSENRKHIVEKVQEFIFGNEDLAKKFENFIDRRSDVVDLKSDEYKLEYTEVYQEYKNLFEASVEDYIVHGLHCTIHDLYDALQVCMKDEYSSEAIFAQILIAMTDFDIFMTMMREAAQKNARETHSSHK